VSSPYCSAIYHYPSSVIAVHFCRHRLRSPCGLEVPTGVAAHRSVGVETLLESYSIERSAIGDQVLKAAEVFTTIATLRNPILTSFQFVRDKVRRNWSEISINYRHGPLCSQQWPSMTEGLAAGDRLGDAPLASAQDGHASTLLQTLDGKRHSLLLLPGKHTESVSKLIAIAEETNQAFPGILATHLILERNTAHPDASSSGMAVWVDTEARAHEQLHAKNATLILVRPDGYIGFRRQPADGTALRAYMQSYLIPAKVA
jgi:hypothetical protein